MKPHPIFLHGFEFKKCQVAENYPDMDAGLDQYDSLDEQSGLIYAFDVPGKYHFDNTSPNFPLDLVLVDKDGMVVGVHTLPPLEKGPEPEQAFLYALEILGGMAARIGLKPGMPAGMDLASLEVYRNARHNPTGICPANRPLPEGWLEHARQELQRQDSERDDLFDLNITLVGAKYDLNSLCSKGWRHLWQNTPTPPFPISGNAPEMRALLGDIPGEAVWLECRCECDDSRYLFRLFCSNPGHFRYLHAIELNQLGGFREETVTRLPDALKANLLNQFREAIIQPAAKDLDQELLWITENVITTDRLPGRQAQRARFAAWTHEFERLNKESPYYRHRFLNGMLRLGCFSNDEDIQAETLRQVLDMKYKRGLIRLLCIILQKQTDFTSATTWNCLGCAFDRLNMKEAALFSVITAWRREYSTLAGQNVWILGRQMLPEFFRRRDAEKAELTADAMLSSVPRQYNPRAFSEVLCGLGLACEMAGDMTRALKCHFIAVEAYCNGRTDQARQRDKNAEEYSPSQTFHDHPLLFQSVFRMTMRDSNTRRAQLERQLDCFPDVPDAKGMDGVVPVEYLGHYGMRDLWNTVAPGLLDKDPQRPSQIIEANGQPCGTERILPQYACGGLFLKKSLGMSYEKPGEEHSPLQSLCLFGLPLEQNHRVAVSSFPAFKPGNGWRLTSPIYSISLWNNAVVALMKFRFCKGHTLECHWWDYGLRDDSLKSGKCYEIEIALFGYAMSRFEGHDIEIHKGPALELERQRLRKEGKDDNVASVKIIVPQDTCSIHPSFDGWPQDVSIVAKVDTKEDFVFWGIPCIKFTLAFDERGGYAKLPVFLAKEAFGDTPIPALGDTVECTGWLQGIVHGEATGTGPEPEEQDNLDASHFVYQDTSKIGLELDELATNAVRRRKGVERLAQFADALPGDPTLSCTDNGQNVFVKVFTGYFNTEKQCRWKLRRALLAIPSRWLGSECRLAAVVGIRSEGNRDGYLIHYLGMSSDSEDWKENLLEFLGVKLKNLHRFKEDLPIQINGQEFPPAQIWHWKYDFASHRGGIAEGDPKMTALMDVRHAWEALDDTAFAGLLTTPCFSHGAVWLHDAKGFSEHIVEKYNAIAGTGSLPKVTLVRLIEGLVPQAFPYALHLSQNDHSTMLTFVFRGDKIAQMFMTNPDLYTFETI